MKNDWMMRVLRSLSNIWPLFSEGKYLLIKDYISRNVNSSYGVIKTLIAFVSRAISKKGELFGSEI
jgi:hypothetical protein